MGGEDRLIHRRRRSTLAPKIVRSKPGRWALPAGERSGWPYRVRGRVQVEFVGLANEIDSEAVVRLFSEPRWSRADGLSRRIPSAGWLTDLVASGPVPRLFLRPGA